MGRSGTQGQDPAAVFRWFGKERSAALRFICSDMWQPYLKVVAKKASEAIHVLDRFHIMAKMNKAIDEVRAKEARELKAKGCEPVLTNARWLLLKRPENLSAKQEPRLAELLQYNLRSVRAYLLKEDFQFFWTYKSPYWAGEVLDRWCTRTLRSRLDPMKKVARQERRSCPHANRLANTEEVSLAERRTGLAVASWTTPIGRSAAQIVHAFVRRTILNSDRFS